MSTSLSLDPELLDRAHAIGGERTKKATVTEALKEYIARRTQRALLDDFGTLEWDESYDHKSHRSRR